MTSSRKTSVSGTPLVSIITPVYNRIDYLGETIESVLAQTLTNWELLIIDDGSETDEGRKIAEKYNQHDSRIHYMYRSHAGTSKTRNHGIATARGKYLGFLDSDDRYLPHCLDTLTRALQSSSKNIKMVYGDFFKYFQSENRYHPTRATPPQPRPGLYFQFLWRGANPVAPCACLVERDVVEKIGGFDSRFDSLEDRELWARLIRMYDIAHIPQKVAVYRKHDNQITKARYDPGRRLANDLHAYIFFSSLPLNSWFPNATSSGDQARALEHLAKVLLTRELTPYDTALYLLYIAQKKHPSQNRQSFMNRLEKKIPRILQKLYGSSERILIPEV